MYAASKTNAQGAAGKAMARPPRTPVDRLSRLPVSTAAARRAGARCQAHLAVTQGRAGGVGVRSRFGEPENPVVALLADLDMIPFARALLENGFDDLNTLQDMSDEDMLELGMRRGHMIKLRRRLSEITGSQGPTPREPTPREAAEPAPQSLQPAAGPRRTPLSAEPEVDCSAMGALQVTGQQMTAVQMSWERVKLLGCEHFGGILAQNFFKVDPEMQTFFPLEVRAKYQSWTADEAAADIGSSPALKVLFGKKVTAVGYFISGMSKTKGILPRVKQMGMRHLGYTGGVLSESHFEKLEEALVLTLKMTLGETFTPEVEVAWSMVFQFMSAIMLCGYREAKMIKEKAEKEVAVKLRTQSTSESLHSEETDSTAPSANGNGN